MKDNPTSAGRGTPARRKTRQESVPEESDEMSCAWVWVRGTLACLRNEVEVELQVGQAPPLAVLLSYRHMQHRMGQLTGLV